MSKLVELIRRFPYLTVVIVGVGFGVMIYFSLLYNWQTLLDVFLTTILAFLISDGISKYAIRGGRRAPQITALGTQIQPESYVYLVFFFSIPIIGLVVDASSKFLTNSVATQVSGLWADVIIGLILAALVYVDFRTKYYSD